VTLDIQTLTLSASRMLFSVNCYLIRNAAGCFLVDTGMNSQRKELEQKLSAAGCKPGALRLVLLTHGDMDHIGNAAYLRGTYGAPIGMHPGDWGMAEQGDMWVNRKQANRVLQTLTAIFFKVPQADRFTPDLALADGDDLGSYGLDASVLELPGHSRGSIGLLTAQNDLFCGDLFENRRRPVINSLMDDQETGEASVARLKELPVNRVFPGHGGVFTMAEYLAEEAVGPLGRR
jgi:glyoxylase-like metal-dependent hydrolase (beta-lactamase superfamily II)